MHFLGSFLRDILKRSKLIWENFGKKKMLIALIRIFVFSVPDGKLRRKCKEETRKLTKAKQNSLQQFQQLFKRKKPKSNFLNLKRLLPVDYKTLFRARYAQNWEINTWWVTRDGHYTPGGLTYITLRKCLICSF